MYSSFNMDTNKRRLYHSENNGWQKAIQLQVSEIPEMEKMIKEIFGMEEPQIKKKLIGKDLFEAALKQQQEEMKILNKEIDDQQKKLKVNEVFDMNACIDVFCAQDILRERIKSIEKKYLELKCDLLYYLSNIT